MRLNHQKFDNYIEILLVLFYFPDCQYGDEFTWCKGGKHCSKRDLKSCCESCTQ